MRNKMLLRAYAAGGYGRGGTRTPPVRPTTRRTPRLGRPPCCFSACPPSGSSSPPPARPSPTSGGPKRQTSARGIGNISLPARVPEPPPRGQFAQLRASSGCLRAVPAASWTSLERVLASRGGARVSRGTPLPARRAPPASGREPPSAPLGRPPGGPLQGRQDPQRRGRHTRCGAAPPAASWSGSSRDSRSRPRRTLSTTAWPRASTATALAASSTAAARRLPAPAAPSAARGAPGREAGTATPGPRAAPQRVCTWLALGGALRGCPARRDARPAPSSTARWLPCRPTTPA
jgi:hypothetical protein